MLETDCVSVELGGKDAKRIYPCDKHILYGSEVRDGCLYITTYNVENADGITPLEVKDQEVYSPGQWLSYRASNLDF